MKILGIRLIKEKTYSELISFKKEVKDFTKNEILKKRFPVVLDKTLKNKNITFSRGCVLINSQIVNSRIDYKCKEALKVFFNNIIQSCVFMKKK